MTLIKDGLTVDTQDFVKSVKDKYNLDVNVILGGTILDQKTGNKIALDILRDEAFQAMCMYDPTLSKYLSMKSRVRKREFLVWSQSFQYLAWMHGYSKLDIAKNLMKNHATIISSINKVSNAIDGFNPDLKKIYEYLTNYYLTHVGDITKNIKR
jgi:hypothetical protein